MEKTKYYLGDQIKDTEIGTECSTYGVEDICIHDLVRKCEAR